MLAFWPSPPVSVCGISLVFPPPHSSSSLVWSASHVHLCPLSSLYYSKTFLHTLGVVVASSFCFTFHSVCVVLLFVFAEFRVTPDWPQTYHAAVLRNTETTAVCHIWFYAGAKTESKALCLLGKYSQLSYVPDPLLVVFLCVCFFFLWHGSQTYSPEHEGSSTSPLS